MNRRLTPSAIAQLPCKVRYVIIVITRRGIKLLVGIAHTNLLERKTNFFFPFTLGWRNTMEDAHIAELNLGDDTYLFGVFDGHGGKLSCLF